MNNIKSLATLIRQKRDRGDDPYILILGAGASLSSGCSSGWQIVRDVVAQYSEATADTTEEMLRVFHTVLEKCSLPERFAILEEHVNRAEPSRGYLRLAELLALEYFNLVLTTNFDQLLETALSEVGISYNQMDVAYNTASAVEVLDRERYEAITIIKLHGDVLKGSLQIMPSETFQFKVNVERQLRDLLSNKDSIVVGHSMRDHDLDRCFDQTGPAIWYVNPVEPVYGSTGWYLRFARPTFHLITGEIAEFDDFFETLYQEVVPQSERTHTALAYKKYNTGVVLLERAEQAGLPELERAELIDDAIRAFEIAGRLKIDEVDNYFRLGQAYERRGMHGNAADAYQQAASLDPGDLQLFYRRAHALLSANRLFDAIKEFRAVLNRDPEYPGALHYLSETRQDVAVRHLCRKRSEVTAEDYAVFFIESEIDEMTREEAEKDLENLVMKGELTRQVDIEELGDEGTTYRRTKRMDWPGGPRIMKPPVESELT